MRHAAAAFVFLSAAALTGHAQSPPPRDSSAFTTKTGTGRISGRVVAAESGDALRNARVMLSPATADAPIVLTDADGRFSFASLPSGTYFVSATKSGYAASTFDGWNVTNRSFRGIQVADGAAITGFTVSIAKGAAITGRILDELGEPVINTSVFVEGLTVTNGARTTRGRWTGQTNDLGDYRVGSLPESDYVVSLAVPPPVQLVRAEGNTFVTTGPRRPQPNYFPNVAALPDAEAISLKHGEERPGVDFIGPRPERPMTDLVRAQDFSPAGRDPSVKATGAIRGRILQSTGGPLAGAEVRLNGDAIRPLPPVNTDGLGQYEFLNLPAGNYTVSARKNRYIPREFGQERSSDRGRRIALAVDERRDRADITLPRTSAIAGQLTDEYGDPVEGVTVRPLQIRFVSGRRRLVEVPSSWSARTDDLGRYRVSGLIPGSYVVAAYVGQLVLGQPGVTTDIPNYATTYFPGTANPPELRTVPVPVSQDVDGVDFALSRTATATVSGMARTSIGEPITGGLVLSTSRRVGLTTTPVGARINPDGTFEFPNVPPGQYVIQAYRGRIRSSVEGEFAAVPVTVNGANVTGLIVQTSPGSTISGRVTFESPRIPTSRNLELSPVPTDLDLAPLDGNLARADVHNDWTFEMSGISGPRRLQLLRAPKGWGLKRILVNGVDATDTPLPFGAKSESLADVEVVLTERVTEITGTVSDDRGRAAADAQVVVFAEDRDLWYDRSRFVSIVSSGPDGGFVVADLPAGGYFVSAVDRMRANDRNGEGRNPELLESLMAGAAKITLTEGQKLSVNLKLATR
jgi:hypothetical protein